MLKLLAQMRAETSSVGIGGITMRAHPVPEPIAPHELLKPTGASVRTVGPRVARCGEARVSLPGGCEIGLRPVYQHIKGLQAMGASISMVEGDMTARAQRLKGARICTDLVTVTGTENLVVAAT